jgi:phenylpropionate dioxygenase-like ring-hydroxylating dioxygenase large terminal subunit
MMTEEENDLLTVTGPRTPGGELLRRYWQPAALSEEMPPGGAPLALKLMGEELVLFRDDKGRPGLLGLRCSHRGTNLSYGRVEDGGLRCLYHGWLYDVQGRCLEQPGEAAGVRCHENIRHKAYPCQEMGGLIFAYLGPGEPPLLPAYEILTVADEKRFVCKVFCQCNYLQGNEGNIDPVHLSFLHRILDEGLAASGRPTPYSKVRGSDLSPNRLFGASQAPTVEVEVTDFGLRIATWRPFGEKAYLRVSNFVMPNLSAVPGETQGAGYLMNWHVPIDDEHHWKYMIVFSREEALDRERFKQRYGAEIDRDYRPLRNRSNRYLQDREQMKTETFSGMGLFFAGHDLFATESQGSIQDRTQEHLVSSDKAIVAARKLLLGAIRDVEEGREPLHVLREPKLNRFPHLVVISQAIPSSVNWREYAKKVGAEIGA